MRRISKSLTISSPIATAALLLSLGTVPTATASRVPGDQPLPPYTVDNPPLAPITAGGAPTQVTQGVYRHSAFDIEVPAHWNGRLVMWAHGFRGFGTVLTVDTPAYGMRQQLVDEGYAWASSSYPDNGYDPGSGVLATKDLATHFAHLVHHPRQTFIVGVSMGGHVVGRSIEQYPHFYAGAMPMCGVLGDDRLFDFYLSYNLAAQDIAGVPAYPLPPDYLTNAVPKIENALGLTGLTPGGPDTTNALGKEFRSEVVNLSGGPRPAVDATYPIWKDFLFAIATTGTGTTLGSNPSLVATNVGTDYQPNSPVDVNATILRHPVTDPRDRFTHALVASPRIFGKPDIPVLSMHTIGDMFVPLSMEEIYGHEVAENGRSGLLVQRAIRAAQHCEFDSAEVGKAWDDLVRWVDTGHRPAGDQVTSPRAVADPNFGCRFTNPADRTGTRALYPTCPATAASAGSATRGG